VFPRVTLRFARGANYPRETLDCQQLKSLFSQLFMSIYHKHSMNENRFPSGIL
jgi:hypothetical protein